MSETQTFCPEAPSGSPFLPPRNQVGEAAHPTSYQQPQKNLKKITADLELNLNRSGHDCRTLQFTLNQGDNDGNSELSFVFARRRSMCIFGRKNGSELNAWRFYRLGNRRHHRCVVGRQPRWSLRTRPRRRITDSVHPRFSSICVPLLALVGRNPQTRLVPSLYPQQSPPMVSPVSGLAIPLDFVGISKTKLVDAHPDFFETKPELAVRGVHKGCSVFRARHQHSRSKRDVGHRTARGDIDGCSIWQRILLARFGWRRQIHVSLSNCCNRCKRSEFHGLPSLRF